MANIDATINGRGLLDYGLYGYSIDGLGINTYGFVFLCSNIWDNADEIISTSWTPCTTGNGNTLESCDDE